MALELIEPLRDSRWDALLDAHPGASVFYTRGWLAALRRTYGYRPLALLELSTEGSPRAALAFCAVKSLITGRRLVSLPFSDHCQPIGADGGGAPRLLEELARRRRSSNWDYAEMRFNPPGGGGLRPSARYVLHRLDLRVGEEALWEGLHPSCVARKARRAEREGIRLRLASGGELLGDFYRLQTATRRRHRLAPQPRRWFRHVLEEMPGQARLYMAYMNERPVAGILTLRHGKTAVYKYGASDADYHASGVMPWLFWQVIREAREDGAETLDLGRSGRNQEGLLKFKDRLGARREDLSYFRLGAAPAEDSAWLAAGQRWFSRLVPVLPDFALRGAGRLLYRHIG